jgi:hypothetical protein
MMDCHEIANVVICGLDWLIRCAISMWFEPAQAFMEPGDIFCGLQLARRAYFRLAFQTYGRILLTFSL